MYNDSDDDAPVRVICRPGTTLIPGLVPPLRRTLFAQDVFHEDDPIRPVYANTMELPDKYSPPASPLASRQKKKFSGSERKPLPTQIYKPSRRGSGAKQPPSSPSSFAVKSEQQVIEVVQQIWCKYNETHQLFVQYIQFALFRGDAPVSLSPTAVFRTWQGSPTADDRPFWITINSGDNTECRSVPEEFALGRAILLSKLRENLTVADELVQWAKKNHADPFRLEHADIRFLQDKAPEDVQDDPQY
ncbi:hypothetical protein R3P38DRAFT_3214519 [Favolaschia claudopus]|uniref:Uncharacterized protein n=1 Tax=Favolaschia claudopus TaxID=2862362 RepID=A0AAW0AB76_9AGAR